jgi:hypothetical protein
VTIFARLLLRRDRDRFGAPRLVASALSLSLLAMLLAFAAPVQAEVKEVAGTKVGLQAANQVSFVQSLREVTFSEATEKITESLNVGPESFGNSTANPVVHGANTYAIYWDPLDRYNPDWQHLINTFFQAMGSSSGQLGTVFGVDTQYTDASNKPAYYQTDFRVAYTDTHKYPAKVCTSPQKATKLCLTDAQMQEELTSFITSHALPKGTNTVYYLLTPPGVTVCVDAAATKCSEFERTKKEEEEGAYKSASYKGAICSYHSVINPGALPTGDANTILYGVVPWVAGFAGNGVASNTYGQAAYCQDGGWNPSTNPAEEREKVRPRTPTEQEEFLKKTPEEQLKIEEQKSLQGPHDQEPNQGPCPNLGDGSCDMGLADLIINQIAVEHQNIVTNPLLNAWQDNQGKEATDECRNFFAPAKGESSAKPDSGAGTLYNQLLGEGRYYVNTAFNLAALLLPYPGIPCIPGGNLIPRFTSPNPVNSGETVGFDGMESIVTLNAGYAFSGSTPIANYATYTWNFGDGTPSVTGYAPGAPACETPWLSPCAASALHSYQYGGTYDVTLSVTDIGGHTTGVSHQLLVNGPPPPSPPAKEVAPGGAAPGAGAAGGAPGPASSPHKPTTPPVAAAAVVSRKLRNVVRGGLVVRYSVNEQVAGRFEILLNRATARRLGIGGPPATGLPAGTPAQVVIGKAFLVTTAAGRNAVKIQFAKRTATRLERLGKVTLMLRLFVRNADAQSPSTTTVLTSFTLGR